jgi:hypothetical protein
MYFRNIRPNWTTTIARGAEQVPRLVFVLRFTTQRSIIVLIIVIVVVVVVVVAVVIRALIATSILAARHTVPVHRAALIVIRTAAHREPQTQQRQYQYHANHCLSFHFPEACPRTTPRPGIDDIPAKLNRTPSPRILVAASL